MLKIEKTEKEYSQWYAKRVKALRDKLLAVKLIEPNLQLKAGVVAILCHQCETLAFTRSNHDMNRCQCGACALDGGSVSTMRIIGKTGTYDIVNSFTIQNKDLKKKYKELQAEAINVKLLGEKIISLRFKGVENE